MKIICSELLNLPGINHAFTMRKSGYSKPPFDSLNCSRFVGDSEKDVLKNRKKIFKKLNLSDSVQLKQLHSIKVVKAEETLNSRIPIEADAIISQTKGFAASVTVADCAPILFANPKLKIVAAAHAGWRGALSGISDNVINEFLKLGSAPKDILVAIGPCIGPNSYEVKKDMKDLAINKDPKSLPYFSNSKNLDGFYFDLPGYLLQRLINLGLSKVCWTGHDTFAEPEKFFSYRYESIKHNMLTGRIIGSIGIK